MSFHDPRRRRCDVLVIGARCAGAATAMLLARGGAQVLAVDREAYGADTLSTHALMRTGVALLHRWGVLDDVKASGAPPIACTTFHYGDEEIEVDIRPGDGISALYAPRRTVLDRLLADAATAAGAKIRHGWSMQDLVRDRRGRVIGAVLQGPDGERVVQNADLVIGADGRQSSVARLAGAPVEVERPESSAGIFGYVRGLQNRGYHWHFRPGAHIAVIPTNDGAHCVAAFVPRARLKALVGADAAAGWRSAVAHLAPGLVEAIEANPPDRLRRYTGAPGHLRRCHGPGWALVGDAGYFKDPLSAHGITDALRDAELLSGAVLGSRPGGLAGYQEIRDRLSLPFFEATAEIAGFEWSMDRLKHLHSGLSAEMKVELAHVLATAAPPVMAA